MAEGAAVSSSLLQGTSRKCTGTLWAGEGWYLVPRGNSSAAGLTEQGAGPRTGGRASLHPLGPAFPTFFFSISRETQHLANQYPRRKKFREPKNGFKDSL